MGPKITIHTCAIPHIKVFIRSRIGTKLTNNRIWGYIMIRAENKTKPGQTVIDNGKHIHEAALTERWAREDLWADLAGEEIEDESTDLDGFDDLLSDRHYND